MHQQRDEKDRKKYKEQNLGNARCGKGDASESQEACDQGDDQENYCVIEHVTLLALPKSSSAQILRR
jgi:hypothetical protein